MVKNIFLIVLAILAVAAGVVAVIKHNKMKKAQEANKGLAERLAEYTIDPKDPEDEPTSV